MRGLLEKTKKQIENEMKYWKIPGVAISVIKDGKLWDSMGFGYRNVEEKLLVTDDTQFGIASISKSMTSALIAILVDKGILNYDEQVTTYAPNLVMQDIAAKGMTLRDMLTHMTGFGTHDALWPGDNTRENLASSLRYIQPCSKYRSEAIYSNTIYALIGYVAECATGELWDDLMQKYIFDPLHMTRTNCSVDIMKKDDNNSIPYRYRKGKLNPLNIWNLDLAGPAASVNCTANDMARWLMMHIAGGKSEDGKILIQPKTFKEMHSVQSYLGESLGEDLYKCTDYSMGWRTGKYKGYTIMRHTGKIEGYSSIQAFMPEIGAGVAILTNFHSPTVAFMYSTLYTIFDEVMGLEPENWIGKFHGEALPKEEDYLDCDLNYFKINEKRIPGTKLSLPLSEYVGTYFDKGYGTLTIELINNVLHMKYRDMDIPLEHYHYDTFKADDVLEDVFLISLPVTFNVADGKAKSVAVRFEAMVSDILFNKVSLN